MTDGFPDKLQLSCKDVTVCLLVVTAMWFLSLTVLSPLFITLYLSSWARNIFFAFIFKFMFSDQWPEVNEMRRRVFAHIDRECKANKPAHLRYLEIGVGTGANFPFYTGNHSLTLLDMNPNFRSTFEAHLKEHPNVNVDKVVISMAENMKDIENDAYDVVVATHFFCSAVDVDAVLKEIKRVLKPGGKLAFMEHVVYPKPGLLFYMQKIVRPVWKTYFNGCRTDRDFLKTLKKHFSNVTYDRVYPNFMPIIVRPHAIGIATK